MKNLFVIFSLLFTLVACQDEEAKLSAADQQDLQEARAESGARLFAEEPVQQQQPKTFDEAVKFNSDIDMKYYDQLCGGLAVVDRMGCYDRHRTSDVAGEAFKQKLAIEMNDGKLPKEWRKYYINHNEKDRPHAKCQAPIKDDLMKARERLQCTVTEYNWLNLYLEVWANGQWKNVVAMQVATRDPMADIKETNSEQYVGD